MRVLAFGCLPAGVLIALLLAACGGGKEVHACDLLTAADVQAVFGGDVRETIPESFGGPGNVSSCLHRTYYPDNSTASVTVFVEQTSEDETRMFFETNKQAAKEELPGLAEGAFYHPGSPFPSVHMIQDDIYIKVWTRAADSPEALAEAKAMAERMVAHLPD